jgi:Rieske Fe-S protein
MADTAPDAIREAARDDRAADDSRHGSSNRGDRGLSRRRVLGGAGAAGLGVTAAAALAACGPVGIKQTQSRKPTGPVGLGSTTDVPVGGGKIYPDEVVVVTQPTAGTFKCFSATCTHAGCLLHDVSGGTINCACHGSQFSIADGSVVRPPAEQPLTSETITVANGKITLA